jgi:16S rRNA C967 or C1407 C5-methylase (RsmB/RsmF family)
VREVRHVDTPRSHVGRHQDVDRLVAELAENLAANLPADFLKYLAESAGDELVPRIAEAIASNPVTAIRLNPFKTKKLLEAGYSIEDILQMIDAEDGGYESIPWCADGFYLNRRPSFTHDPLFHAGLYYVQEPSSMFLSVLQPIIDSLLRSVKRLNVLDLCASPGGKTTHLCSMLGSKENLPNSDRSLLICNEVIRSRTGALAENMVKWGRHTNVMVTSEDASKFSVLDGFFHLILVDAPCSGEGMFRKDRDSATRLSVRREKVIGNR